jgi:beta-glucanase (GH16 family)
MVHFRYTTIMACAILLASQTTFAQNQAKTKNEWKLIWNDEFDGTKLDTSKWNVLLRENSKHGELQYYVPDEVYIDKGLLILRSRKRNFGSKEYTSGRLDTKGKFAPTYGRFEIRARLPHQCRLSPHQRKKLKEL